MQQCQIRMSEGGRSDCGGARVSLGEEETEFEDDGDGED